MLTRVLEPEAMDSPEEALAYDAMDHSAVNRVFVDDLLAACAARGVELAGEVLDLGTGSAQIPVELCERRDQLLVRAVDLSASMLDVALANIEVAGFRERIMLEQIDAKEPPYDDGQFACVMSNSIIHHVADPSAVLAQALRVAAPGSLVFFRDLLRPDDDAAVRKIVETYAGDATGRQRQMFEDSLRAALSLEEMREIIENLGCDPSAVRQTTDRHWTWTAWTEN